jgi:NAD(P)-dependent dehydrogenase (short-subunit alcohol dehydrogenase family)
VTEMLDKTRPSSVFRADLFAGKVAFIAGGTSGINLGIARRLAQLGAKVAVVGRDLDKAKRAEAEIAPARSKAALGLSADVRNYDSVRAALETAAARFGPIDFVISGAAGNFVAPALGMSANAFRTVVDIDLNGTFNVFRACHDLLNLSGASLIAISAGHAVNAIPRQAHVCAAKAGINQLVRVLALEWGPFVRVNAISPGPIAGTEGMARLAPDEGARAAHEACIALRRWGEVDDIANAAVFLCSPAASLITGTVLDVDGGSGLGDASAGLSGRGIV